MAEFKKDVFEFEEFIDVANSSGAYSEINTLIGRMQGRLNVEAAKADRPVYVISQCIYPANGRLYSKMKLTTDATLAGSEVIYGTKLRIADLLKPGVA